MAHRFDWRDSCVRSAHCAPPRPERRALRRGNLRITTGPSAPGWSALDAALLRAADELHLSRFVSDSTWNALAQRYTQDQLEGVVLIVGNYTQLTMFQNTLGAQLSPNIEGLPDSTAIR